MMHCSTIVDGHVSFDGSLLMKGIIEKAHARWVAYIRGAVIV